MSTTVMAGWLKDEDGNRFAPKTMSSQVIEDDGTLLKDNIELELSETKTYIDNAISAKADISHGHTIEDITNLQSALDNKSDSSHTHSDYAPKASPVFTGSISLGRKDNTLVSNGSVAVGHDNMASNSYAFAEGYSTSATGYASHSSGSGTIASGDYAFAAGLNNIAEGKKSVVFGEGNTAGGYSSLVHGQYNVKDTENKYVHIVGNGKIASRSNAYTLDWDGNAWFKGDVYIGGASQDDETAVRLITESDELITIDDIDEICGGVPNSLQRIATLVGGVE